MTATRTAALPRLRPRTAVILVLVSLVGAAGFGWPFLRSPDPALGHAADAPWLLAVVTSLALAAALAALLDETVDAKALALLGVLAAVGAALRPFGAGVAGIEPMFVVLVLGARVLGPALGFTLGSTAMLASALLTAGVGPWLPFQMVAAAWVAAGAGLLPRARGRLEIALLASYALVLGPLFGALMNLWFWPLAADASLPIAFDPAGSLTDNLHRYARFYVATSLGWDVPRGLLTATLVVLAGRRVMAALRRAVARAHFDAPVEFVPPESIHHAEPAVPRAVSRTT